MTSPDSPETPKTPLDAAFLAAQSDPSGSARFFDALMAATLYLPVHDEPEENPNGATSISPMIFDLDGEETLLVFDTEERLAEWADEPLNYVGLTGADIFQMFNGDQQLGLNIGVAPSSLIISREDVAWLHARAMEAVEAETIPAGSDVRVEPPQGAPREAVAALTSRLAAHRADIEEATLFRMFIRGPDGRETSRMVLGLKATPRGARRAEEVAMSLARTARTAFALNEPMEVTVLDPSSELLAKAREVGLRLPIIDLKSFH